MADRTTPRLEKAASVLADKMALLVTTHTDRIHFTDNEREMTVRMLADALEEYGFTVGWRR